MTDSPIRIAITGAASGLGRELALRWAREGARVAIADLHAERSVAVADEVVARGGEALVHRCDVRRTEDLETLVAACRRAWGGLDVFVSNAGIAGGGTFETITDEQWLSVLDIDLMGVVRGARAVVPLFKAQGSGTLVNVASMAGLLAPPGMASYNVAKTGVVALSETLHGELAPFGIRVVCVCPSFFQTNLLESLDTSDDAMRRSFERLLRSSDLTAADVAERVFASVAARDFLCLPHPKGREALDQKRRDYAAYLAEMERIGHSLVRKAGG